MLNNSPTSQLSLHADSAAISRRLLPPMKDQVCWEFTKDHLAQGIPVTVLLVAEGSAGSPGRRGFKMAIAANGEMVGTIGGGIMEFKFIKEAIELCRNPDAKPRAVPQFHTKEAADNRSGMICSGSQVNIVIPCFPRNLATITDIAAGFPLKRGVLTVNSESLSYDPDARITSDTVFSNSGGDNWTYRERIGPRHTMHVIGGGHVGMALCRAMRILDFYVKVYDHRPDLHLLAENDWAHEKIVTPFEELASMIPEGSDQFVAVVSTSFKTDEAALRVLAGKKFAYLGAMGSTTKISHIKEVLTQSGTDPETLSDLHAPIGVAIRSHTVEEIAVSIAAQIIHVKNSQA